MNNLKWAIATCDNCGFYFAVDESQHVPDYLSCPNCVREDVDMTGEYLDNELYTKNGKKI